MLNNPANKKYLILFLFVLSFVLFGRTLHYGFVWDDERIHLTNNPQLMNGDVKSFWEKPYAGMYIPLTYTAWSVIRPASLKDNHLSPKLFHLLNVCMHGINAVLVFLLLLFLFKNQSHAFIGSLVFLLHPLQVESVAWISEFRGLFSAFFSLLSLLFFFRYIEKNSVFDLRSLLSNYFLLASIFFLMALLAKPVAVVLPFVTGVLYWCFYREKFGVSIRPLIAWLLLIVPILLITKQVQANEQVYSSVALWQRFFIAGNSLCFYVCKIVLPHPLVSCYGYTPTLVIHSAVMYIGTFFCIASSVFCFIKRNTYPFLFSGFAIIVISLSPVLGFVSFEYQVHSTVADHYMYLGMLGVALFVPLLLDGAKRFMYMKYIPCLLLAFYVVLTAMQVPTWKNEFTVWDNVIVYYQNSAKVYYNRGVEYSKMKKFNEAISDYTQSLALEPKNLDALFNRANAFENINDLNSAYDDYNAYLAIDSKDGSVYFKRAYLNYRAGNIQEAMHDAATAEQLGFPVNPKFKNVLMTGR